MILKLQQVRNFLAGKVTLTLVLFFVILVIGIFARVWEFGSTPPGLNVDEASIGVEAYNLYKFGMDRNGLSYPVIFLSWGTGQQNALYAYLLLPFIILGGLNPFFIRLPMMLSGILSLPLMYFVGRKLGDERFGLICMFLMAISPWHIINTRWAVESNIFPFVFLLGFAALLAIEKDQHWFVVACAFFSLCLYAYGAAYASVPIFLVLSVIILLYYKRVTVPTVLKGLIVFAVMAFPIFLYILINTFKLNTIYLGPITIPRTLIVPRFQYMSAMFGGSPLKTMATNLASMIQLLWQQADGLAWNYVEPYGYFYKISLPFALAGLFLLVKTSTYRVAPQRWLLLSWILAALSVGVIQPSNLTRINLIFTPLLIGLGFLLMALHQRVKYSLLVSVVILSGAFIFFNISYHGAEYRRIASGVFNAGIIPAIEYANQATKGDICITDKVYFGYIYVLYAQKINPAEYLDKTVWVYPDATDNILRIPERIGRFIFVGSKCPNTAETVYILPLKESQPDNGVKYKDIQFSKFRVLIPKK
jgi:hypothetical protein